jgi:hypothetical protein
MNTLKHYRQELKMILKYVKKKNREKSLTTDLILEKLITVVIKKNPNSSLLLTTFSMTRLPTDPLEVDA